MKILCIGGVSDGEMRNAMNRTMRTAAPSPKLASVYEFDRYPQPVAIIYSDYRIETFTFPNSATGALEKRYFWVEESLSPLAAFDLLLSGYNRPAKASKTFAAA